jgi:tetratricopeptide (TPR) repeat protein
MPSVGTVEMATGLYQSHEVARVGIQTNVGTSEAPTRGLDEYRRALEDVLKRRPNWSEGHVRLGIVHLALYRQMTKEWRDDSGFSVNDVKGMAEPLLLLGRAYKQTEETNDSPAKPDFLSFKPLLRHGTPAAHSFLEARRCSPFLALPHAELAALQYLLASGNSASTYATRALILSGSDGQLLTYLAQIGVQIGDRQLAARCWQKSLKTNPSRWPEVADAARKFLSSDEILRDVATDGGDAIRFADRLYPAAHQRPIRNRFLEVAIERFATRRPMITAEQLFLEAHALASLNQPERARKEMESALAMEPAQAAWREEYIEWLLHWGRADEAYAQALSGRYFSPQSKAIRDAVDRTARVLASGGTLP